MKLSSTNTSMAEVAVPGLVLRSATVLMVGGNISGETRTVAIAIYDKVQAFDDHNAGIMSAALVAFSFLSISLIHWLGKRVGRYD